jgi:hypothetical protein
MELSPEELQDEAADVLPAREVMTSLGAGLGAALGGHVAGIDLGAGLDLGLGLDVGL